MTFWILHGIIEMHKVIGWQCTVSGPDYIARMGINDHEQSNLYFSQV